MTFKAPFFSLVLCVEDVCIEAGTSGPQATAKGLRHPCGTVRFQATHAAKLDESREHGDDRYLRQCHRKRRVGDC
jgi:hypothetical protein